MDINKLKYIFKNIALAYNIEDDLWKKVSFGNSVKPELPVHVIISSKNIIEVPALDEWKNDSIPFLFNDIKQKNIIEEKEGVYHINYDVLTPIYYLLSGEQEINAPKDKYGRFQWKDSLQCKFNITTVPVVNYYMDILIHALSKALNTTISPREKGPQIHLTHDIDEVTSAWKQRVRMAFEQKKYFKALNYFISQSFKPFFPWKNLEEIASMELELGYTPTFYFLPKMGKEGNIKNADYAINDSYIKSIFKKFKSNGIELGLHGSYRTHDNLNSFTRDKKALEKAIEKEVIWNRFHWLQFDIIETPDLLDAANITHDSTLGFQEHISFRNGCCTPFYLYNHKTNRATAVIEHPLAIMDCSLAYELYMGLTPIEAKQAILTLFNNIKKFNGALTMNWHNTFLTDYRHKEWFKLYREVIEELSQELNAN